MIDSLRCVTVVIVTAVSAPQLALAQPALSLRQAIGWARANNPDARAAAIEEREAAARVTTARAARRPRIDVTESWQRGNDPAFVFGARLTQRRLSEDDLGLDALNRPVASGHFRTSVSAEQALFDRVTATNVKAASIGRDIAAAGRRLVEQDLTAAVTDAFGRVLVASAMCRATAAAVEAARADRALAASRRDAGRVTDADVLQLEVYLAAALERQVEATSAERIARARLNQLMGEPLDALFALDASPPGESIDLTRPADLEHEAVTRRPDVALAAFEQQLAAADITRAKSAFLPQVVAHAAWELNGGSWDARESSWAAGATVRLNLFHGLGDKARLAEARAHAERRAIEKSRTDTLARLDVQVAIARLEAARANELVGRAATDRARESQRIIRDRYQNGLADAALLLRAADAVQQADAQEITARVNVLTATAALQRAIGRP